MSPLDPDEWLAIANFVRPKLPSTTKWFSGVTHPTRIGWYERHFTDSRSIGDGTMQYWTGKEWRARPDFIPHWRQVGDYPCWRGLAVHKPQSR